MNAAARVRCSGAAGYEADAGPPGQLAIGIRHHRRPTFVAADKNVDRRVVQCVEHRKVTFAGNAGEAFHALRDQLIDENLPTRSACCFGHPTPLRKFESSVRELSRLFI